MVDSSAEETVIAPGGFVPGGHGVAAGRGGSWIASGWVLFKRQPGMWIAIILVLFIILIALAFIPLIGGLAIYALTPVCVGGLVIGCRALDEGRRLEFAHLFAGFQTRFGTLLATGAVFAVAWLVTAFFASAVTGVSMSVLIGAAATPLTDQATMTNVLLASLIMLALILPVVMAVWFAPPLVVFHQLGALEAMKSSFLGCLRNIVPFLVYGVIGLALAIAATIPLALGWLVLGPVLAASVYTGYRDLYFS